MIVGTLLSTFLIARIVLTNKNFIHTFIICVAVVILTLMWLFGTAFGEWIMDEWGHQAINLDE